MINHYNNDADAPPRAPLPLYPLPQLLTTILLFFVSVDLTSLGIFAEVESYSICPFVTGLFHTA